MESDKRTRSGSSSSEEEEEISDQGVVVEVQDGVISSSTGNTKRSYECTYCKRGFTNAQALGGHMNIHRKDRASKLKQQQPFSPADGNPSRNNYAGAACYNAHHPGVEMQRGYGYDMYVPSPTNCSPRSNFPLHFHEAAGNLPWRRASDGRSSRLDANLTLGCGSNDHTTSSTEEDGEKHGLDLELRLGPDP